MAERVQVRFEDVYQREYPMREMLEELACELLDHVAARSVQDPDLEGERTRLALTTAAECLFGVLETGCCPAGDWEIPFPLTRTRFTSEEKDYDEMRDATDTVTARTWVDAFNVCVASGLVWEWERVLGLLLREDYAPMLHKNLPHAERDSFSEPADLAHMDTLCAYLTPPRGHLPHDWPQVTLRKPSVDERLDAALALDAAGARSPDQKLLRILLRDGQSAFEHALRDRLEEHRATVGEDPAPRSLLPLEAIALAALAVQVHGWSLQTTSGYLPAALLNAPAASNA
ncbi:immunity 49 family protein [Streptomyces sp. MMS21 TC-5]|uniref:Imm49 family immunity protein n=1 Tax=Streptomyces sp. MMS21 TC-5 TaxID=2925833 RepID=UPI001F609A49|nr:Imm49 family immunity protein [Streptomyces sp. MMS21 TC-5]MCI4079039.1 immunity 49 family protein [Streptomyces sp. MMS21 TC-5]